MEILENSCTISISLLLQAMEAGMLFQNLQALLRHISTVRKQQKRKKRFNTTMGQSRKENTLKNHDKFKREIRGLRIKYFSIKKKEGD